MAAWDDPIAYQRGLEAKLARVQELGDEWATEGPSLVRNAYDGSNVTEGQTLERCAAAIHAALSDNGNE